MTAIQENLIHNMVQDTERMVTVAYKQGFDDAMHVAEEWQAGKALTPAAIRTMAWRAKERMMGRDPYRKRNGGSA